MLRCGHLAASRGTESETPGLSRAALLLALAVAAGCAHPCGYVDLRGRQTVLDEAGPTDGGQIRLRLLRPLSPGDRLLEARLEVVSVRRTVIRREVYGRRTYVPYAWYAPLVKPVVSASLVMPFWLAFRCPHTHGDLTWGVGDYLRDVASWFNPASAVPIGPQRVEGDEVLVESEIHAGGAGAARRGLAGRQVELMVNGRRAGQATTDRDGVVRFDLAGCLEPEERAAGATARLLASGSSGEAVVLEVTIPAGLQEPGSVRRTLRR